MLQMMLVSRLDISELLFQIFSLCWGRLVSFLSGRSIIGKFDYCGVHSIHGAERRTSASIGLFDFNSTRLYHSPVLAYLPSRLSSTLLLFCHPFEGMTKSCVDQVFDGNAIQTYHP